jgi:hypothetical protein
VETPLFTLQNSKDDKIQQKKRKGKGKSNGDERVVLENFCNGFQILTMETSGCFEKFLQ